MTSKLGQVLRSVPTCLVAFAACSTRIDLPQQVFPDDGGIATEPGPDAGSVLDAGPDRDASVVTRNFETELRSATDFARLQGDGREVKYLARVTGLEPFVRDAECLFQDTARYPFHIQFLHATFPSLAELDFETYVALVLRRTSRRMWGGVMRHYPRISHPHTGLADIVAYTIYTEGGAAEIPTLGDIVEVDRRLRACAPFAATRLVFVPDGAEQVASARVLQGDLTAQGVAVRFPEELADRQYEPYSLGESYGFLRVLPNNANFEEEVGSRDILVTQGAPADLTTVAGLLTDLPQSLHSHTNLRLREKARPNAMVVGILDDPRLEGLKDQLVHVVVDEAGLTLEAARIEDAERFWAAHRPVVGPVRSDLTTSRLSGFDELSNSDALAYGVKAANLGELHRVLPEKNRVHGFGVPFHYYHEFVVHNGVDEEVAALLSDPRVHTDRVYRAKRLDDVRDSIRDGVFPPGMFDGLAQSIEQTFGPSAATTFVRFRSSTNAEDLDEFSGAGLYDSRTGCLADDRDADDEGPSHCLSEAHRTYLQVELARRETELAEHPERVWLEAIIDDVRGDLTDEKPVAEAVRKVWRSLWNLRAFDERDYYGIDHRGVYMGIAVAPTFVMERQEAVVVTHLTPDDGAPLYRVVTQVGEVGVVRPEDPSAVAETLTFRRVNDAASDVKVLVPSSLSNGARLWSDAELRELSARLFTVHDHFASDVYPHLDGLRLDLEVEVTSDDRIVIKQARPYLSTEP